MYLRENPPDREIKKRNMIGFGGALREGKTGEQERRREPQCKNPQGLIGTWVKAKGIKGGGRTVTVNNGRRRWVRAATMWAALCSWRGGKDLVQHIEMDTMMNSF